MKLRIKYQKRKRFGHLENGKIKKSEVDDLLNENDESQELYANGAYTGENQEQTITQHKINIYPLLDIFKSIVFC